MNNVLFIIRKPECAKVEAYRVVSYKTAEAMPICLMNVITFMSTIR